MTNLLKLLGVLADLLVSFLNRRDVARRAHDIQVIRNDPAGQFANKFGGVPDDASKANVPSAEASPKVDSEEWRWRNKH